MEIGSLYLTNNCCLFSDRSTKIKVNVMLGWIVFMLLNTNRV